MVAYKAHMLHTSQLDVSDGVKSDQTSADSAPKGNNRFSIAEGLQPLNEVKRRTTGWLLPS